MTEPLVGPPPGDDAADFSIPVMPFPAAEASSVELDHAQTDEAPTIISRNVRTNESVPLPELKLRPLSRNGKLARTDSAFTTNLRGRQLAQFQLHEAIGVGGMAAVIRARDTQLDRNVALKILPPDMAADPENIRRFNQEAKAAAKLDHENIARVFFCGEDQGLHFISFEFVEGDNLRTILERLGHLPVPEAINYTLQIATGLAHAAARGVVHRDIKPSNIIITPTGRAKLVDMGLARSMEPQNDLALTQSGVTLGTFDYISPEQALEPREADVRSDIYSLGCTFYHMVTGQAPVPEGTAAKKLYHHQHVAPVDPRQLYSDIPDDVAAVLARMMAKDPKERYQRAEHLVQHLLQLAQKLGSTGDVPSGVLFVDAPLPNPPRMRPFLVSVVAGFVLLALVILQGIYSTSSSQAPPTFSGSGSDKILDPPAVAHTPESSTPTSDKKDPVPVVPVRNSRPSIPEARTTRELANLLQQKNVSEIVVAGDLDLNEGEREAARAPGLVWTGEEGRTLKIHGTTSGPKPTIKLTYDIKNGELEWTALTIKGGRVVLNGLRFEVDARQAPNFIMAALKLQESGSLNVERCEFVQINPPALDPAFADQGRLSSVVLEGKVASARLTLSKCSFVCDPRKTDASREELPIGQEALTLTGLGKIQVTDCAFGPHATLFHVQNDNSSEPIDLSVRRCSALMAEGSVFQVDAGTPAHLLLEKSLFSRPANSEKSIGHPATLLYQTGADVDVRYEGTDNRFHNLTSFWRKSSPEEVIAGTLEAFQEKLNSRGNRSKENKSLVLDASPWNDKDPLTLLNSQPREAFRIKDDIPELRQSDYPTRLVGLESFAGSDSYESKLPPLSPKVEITKPVEKTKVVDPAVAQSGQGKYRTLRQAIDDADPGDVILIKQGKGPLEFSPVSLEKAVSLHPFPGEHPVLTLGETTDQEAAVFKVHDSELRIEGLEFLLKPRQPEFHSQSVVTMAGLGLCQFKNCLFTLDGDGNEDVSLSVVSLTDPRDSMKMGQPSTREAPEIQFNRCFARGRGDLVAMRASRPMTVDVKDSLVVLNGSFLNAEANPREVANNASIRMNLDHLTAYLTDNLIRLRAAREMKGLVAVDVKQASNCLFISASGKALVHLEGMETTEQQMKHLFTWQGDHNAYNKFVQLLDQKPTGDDMPLLPFGPERWKTYTNEMNCHFVPGKIADLPPVELSLTKVVASQFKPRVEADLESYGAPVLQLPHHGVESGPTVP